MLIAADAVKPAESQKEINFSLSFSSTRDVKVESAIRILSFPNLLLQLYQRQNTIASLCNTNNSQRGEKVHSTGEAELVQKMSADVITAFQTGLLTREEALDELKSRVEALGVYAKMAVQRPTASG